MENWFNKLLELDNYTTLSQHCKNDESNKVIVFPMKARFHFYESLGDSKGETCFIRESDFKSYMENVTQTSLLDIVPCENFMLEVNDSKQLKGINSKTWDSRSFCSDYGLAPYLNKKYNLSDHKHSLFCLGRNIKHVYKDYDGEGYSYVMLYYDKIMDMVVVFKATYHEVGKKDLSFETFKENKNDESKSEDILDIDTIANVSSVDIDYLFTKMSNSNIFNKLLNHAVFKHEVKHSPGLKSQFIRLHEEINPKKKWRLGLNYSNSDSR